MQTKLTARTNLLSVLLLLAVGAHAATTQLADSPLSGAMSTEVKPNIMFVLDDSASMDWDYLPDWAGQTTLISQSKNPSFNGVAYNPAIQYVPPKYFNVDGSLNSTAYPGQTSATTSNWTLVKNDGYGIQSTSNSNLIGNAFYFTTIAGEYCTDKTLKVCAAASSPSPTFPEAALMRWCKTAADAVAAIPAANACQATQIKASGSNIPFEFPRMPSPRSSTVSISGTSSTSVNRITVDNLSIFSTAIPATTSPTTMALNIESSINACTFGRTGSCEIAGYSAIASGSTVTISAPGISSSTPSVDQSGSMTIAATPLARPSTNLAPGENVLTVITSTTTAYPKDSTRADCADVNCTYVEEMTNYANWWAYYRTRMQSMKTATSRSFEPIIDKYRIGYSSINNNTTSDFRNIADFDGPQKKAWYDKLFAAVPSLNTPLRVALSNAGRLYSGKLSVLNGVSVVDPVQYFCQQNVTILSTDGYWNEAAGFTIDGSTPVGDQDGPGLEVRPQLDAGGPQDLKSTRQMNKLLTPTQPTWLQKKTAQLQSKTAILETRTLTQGETRTSDLQSKTGQWQSQDWKLQTRTKMGDLISTLTQDQEQTNQLQMRTGPLQKRTASLQKRTKTQTQTRTAQLQSQGGQLQSRSYQLQQRLTQVQRRTSSNAGTSWTSWADVASCTLDTSGTDRVDCRTLAQSGWNNAASCSVIVGGRTDANVGTDLASTTYTTSSDCQYTGPSAWADAGSCTAVAKSPASPYTVGTAVDCQTIWSGTWVNASSCTTSASQQCRYTAWTGWTDAGSCTGQNPSTSSPYTVGVARECRTDWTAWANTASTCTASATVGCQYGAWSGYTNDATCSPVTKSTSNPWSVITAKECAVAYGAWQPNQSACTPDTTGGTRTQCQYVGWSGWSNVGSCSTTSISGPPYSGPGRNCQKVWTTPTPGVGCVPSATMACTTDWTAWGDVASPGGCTVSATKECRYALLADWHNTANCTSNPRSSGPNYTVNSPVECQMTWPNNWVNAVGGCTAAVDKQCQYTAWSGWSGTGACNALPQTGASPFVVDTARECRMNWTPWSTTGSCTAVAGATECNAVWTNPWVNAAACTDSATLQCQTVAVSDWSPPLAPSALSDALLDTVVTSSGITCSEGMVGGLTTSCRSLVPNPSLLTPTPSCTPEAAEASNNYVERTCVPLTTGPVIAACSPVAASALNNYVETTCGSPAEGATPDTLADVAEYYWKTDLRDPGNSNCTGGPIVSGAITTTTDVCLNDPTIAPRQFMSTYTLGLGASGLMQYQENYKTATSGDFYSVKTGADASLGNCAWQKNGECNWPKPQSNEQSNIDDLWHAAVNGRGSYFSAGNPSAMAAGISSALKDVDVKGGALAAITVTNPNLSAGDSSFFEVSFAAGTWTGDVRRFEISPTQGTINPVPSWAAQSLLDAKVAATTHSARIIYTFNSAGESSAGAGDQLKSFVWGNLSAPEQEYFRQPHIATLSQLCAVGSICLSTANNALADEENLVNFLRGDRTNEIVLFRKRLALLGDIGGSEAVYVKKSPWNYTDHQYSAFKTTNNTRTGMVYVGANDGMLHAFNATDGQEAWAYVPGIVLPNLYQLADTNYDNLHRFFVDGAPVTGDICVSNCRPGDTGTVWKTILVGGLNKGGRGYYALDITNPAAPKALWEFTDNNLGYTYGNPVISKLKDGTWVVMFASGYNNVSPGDGQGRLFIVNADTGALVRSITTNVGSTSTPSGLSRISAWATFPDNNNTTLRVYAGDLLGNLWRFDVNGDIPFVDPPVFDAQRLAVLKDSSGATQPITTRPELAMIKNSPVLFVGTGQLLGSSDLLTAQTQTVYGIKDRLSLSDYGSPRPQNPAQTDPEPGVFVAQTMTANPNVTCPAGSAFCRAGDAIVTVSKNPVNFSTDDGWYVDFPIGGERVNTDIRLVQGTLAFTTNTPQSGACVPLGVSYSFFLDSKTGGYVEGTSGFAAFKYGDYLSSRPALVKKENGEIVELTKADCDGPGCRRDSVVPVEPPAFSTRRISWRELNPD